MMSTCGDCPLYATNDCPARLVIVRPVESVRVPQVCYSGDSFDPSPEHKECVPRRRWRESSADLERKIEELRLELESLRERSQKCR